MKLNLNSSFTVKALSAFTVFMSLFYIGGGLYFIFQGIEKHYWQGILVGSLLILYGFFRAFRAYQKQRNEKS